MFSKLFDVSASCVVSKWVPDCNEHYGCPKDSSDGMQYYLGYDKYGNLCKANPSTTCCNV
jgi:hypothetical protein